MLFLRVGEEFTRLVKGSVGGITINNGYAIDTDSSGIYGYYGNAGTYGILEVLNIRNDIL